MEARPGASRDTVEPSYSVEVQTEAQTENTVKTHNNFLTFPSQAPKEDLQNSMMNIMMNQMMNQILDQIADLKRDASKNYADLRGDVLRNYELLIKILEHQRETESNQTVSHPLLQPQERLLLTPQPERERLSEPLQISSKSNTTVSQLLAQPQVLPLTPQPERERFSEPLQISSKSNPTVTQVLVQPQERLILASQPERERLSQQLQIPSKLNTTVSQPLMQPQEQLPLISQLDGERFSEPLQILSKSNPTIIHPLVQPQERISLASQPERERLSQQLQIPSKLNTTVSQPLMQPQEQLPLISQLHGERLSEPLQILSKSNPTIIHPLVQPQERISLASQPERERLSQQLQIPSKLNTTVSQPLMQPQEQLPLISQLHGERLSEPLQILSKSNPTIIHPLVQPQERISLASQPERERLSQQLQIPSKLNAIVSQPLMQPQEQLPLISQLDGERLSEKLDSTVENDDAQKSVTESERERLSEPLQISSKSNLTESQPIVQPQQLPLASQPDRERLSKICDTSENDDAQISVIEELNWLREEKPLKTPYYPQLNDNIVYFRQGHKAYLEEVKKKQVYDIKELDAPWTLNMDVKAHEFVRVKEITFENRSPHLCCLRVERIDKDGHLTGESFGVKYHDMKGVVDFMILKQVFDDALVQNWNAGSRFRCMVEDDWFFGHVVSSQAFHDEFPDSQFKRLRIRWDDDGKTEEVSPWELETVDNLRLPATNDDTVPVTPEEIRRTQYRPQSGDWPDDNRKATCNRILHGIRQLVKLPIAKPFIDLNKDDSYFSNVDYPIDLATIKARVKNNFYRRAEAIKFDVDYLEKNIKKIEEDSIEVRSLSKIKSIDIMTAFKIISKIFTEVLQQQEEVDVHGIYYEFLQESQDFDKKSDSVYVSSICSQSQSQLSIENEDVNMSKVDWQLSCQRLLNTLWDSKDSIPFRGPVDFKLYPDYQKLIATPLSLREIKESLSVGEYKNASQFFADMSLIFKNSRKFNTHKKSEIYKQTTRLLELYESQKERVIFSCNISNKSPVKAGSPKSKSKSVTRKRIINPDSSDENSEDSVVISPPKRQRKQTNINLQIIDEAGPSNGQRKPPLRFGNAFFQNGEDDEEDSVELRSEEKRKRNPRTSPRISKRSKTNRRSDENYVDSVKCTDDLDQDSYGSESCNEESNGSNVDENDDDLSIMSEDNNENDDTVGSGSSSYSEDEENDEDESSQDETDSDKEENEGSQSLSQIPLAERLRISTKRTKKNRRRCKKKSDLESPLKKRDFTITSDDFTSTECLQNAIMPGMTGLIITGRVVEVVKKQWIEYKNLRIFKFVVENNEGVKVHFHAWKKAADYFDGKIKRNQIVRVINVSAKASSRYNRGDLNYELILHDFSKVDVQLKDRVMRLMP